MFTRIRLVVVIFLINFFGAYAQKDSLLHNYFYTGKQYGSESLYNPFSLIVNGGYDIYQLSDFNRQFLDFNYKTSAENVSNNLFHFNATINQVGWWHFTKTELLPLTFNTKGAQWVPNYLLHTMGGGMSCTRLTEWYESQNVPIPKIFSILTVLSAGFLNELAENGEYVGYNSDPISDTYIFNIAGIILFNFPEVNKFFSQQLHMSDWSLQPTLTIPNLALNNSGQYFSLKYNLPFTPRWSLFSRMGMSTMGGLSYKIDTERSLSFGAGARAYKWIMIDSVGRQQSVSTRFTAGVFYDKNNSLMASLVFSDVEDCFLDINIYPGILHLGKLSPGFWTIIKKDGTPIFGISSSFFIGLGGDFTKTP